MTKFKSVLSNPVNREGFLGSSEKIEFTLKESTDYLNALNLANTIITTRSLTLIGILIASITALMAYSLSGGIQGSPEPLKLASFGLAIYFYCVSLCLAKNIETTNTPALGTAPDDLINEKTCQKDYPLERLKLHRINYLQEKTDKAFAINAQRAVTLNRSIRALLVAPIVYTSLLFAFIHFVEGH